MLVNLFKVAIRNLQRQKFYSFLNILGLVVGITSCLFISLYIADELSYDNFHDKGDRIYRIDQTYIWGDLDNKFGSTGPAVATAVKTEIPEFETITRIHSPGPQFVSNKNGKDLTVFEENRLYAADSNFFEVFTFPLVRGNSSTALYEPNSIILTQEIAEKYFGSEDILGKTLAVGEGENERSFKVTGVAQDIPSNSHIEFDFLISMSSIPRVRNQNWTWIWTTFVTFGVLHPEANLADVEQRLLDVPSKHAGSSLQRLQGISFEEYEASGKEWKLYAQPLLGIHLMAPESFSRLNDNIGDIKVIYILGSVGLLILLISLINFMNLATARSSSRAKEVGIRKVIGSGKRNLIIQFLMESVIFSLIALFVSLLLTEALIPLFNQFAAKELSYSFFENPVHLAGLVILGVIVGMLAGTYPSFYLTSFQPVSVLKGKINAGVKSSKIRNILVVVQFSISIMFIACTSIVYKQLAYTDNYDLGFDRDNKVIINNAQRLGGSMENFKEGLLAYSEVTEASISVSTPPFFWNNDNFSLKGSDMPDFPLEYEVSDDRFLDVYDFTLLAGRNFDEKLTDKNRVIINEACLRQLQLANPEDALQKVLRFYDRELTIIGVVKDFNASFATNILPWALIYEGSDVWAGSSNQISVEMNASLSESEITSLISKIENDWRSFENNIPFNYTFLDQEYAAQFAAEQRFGSLLTLFTGLAIIIASLGLIGLIAFVIEKRNKEIGIRKVLGASISNILVLLSSEFGKLLLIGFIIATPISWYLMDQWLNDFPFRTEITVFVFLGAGAAMLLIAFLTTSFQTIKAAMMNPVESIKDE